MSMLEINDIHVFYGAIHAIKGVSFEVREHEIVTLIGANGAGKSTILNTVAGLLKPRSGQVLFEADRCFFFCLTSTVFPPAKWSAWGWPCVRKDGGSSSR